MDKAKVKVCQAGAGVTAIMLLARQAAQDMDRAAEEVKAAIVRQD